MPAGLFVGNVTLYPSRITCFACDLSSSCRYRRSLGAVGACLPCRAQHAVYLTYPSEWTGRRRAFGNSYEGDKITEASWYCVDLLSLQEKCLAYNRGLLSQWVDQSSVLDVLPASRRASMTASGNSATCARQVVLVIPHHLDHQCLVYRIAIS